MTKQTGTIDVSSFTTDAKFRTWGLACSTALQATPLVKTSDTGQINWASVTKPVAINTQAGYEIYRFSDTLQSTKPVYIRVGYGSGGTASGNSPCTWVTVGTGTDGAGTITGVQTAALQGYNTSVAVANVAMPYYFTFTSNGYCLMHFGQGLVSAGVVNNAGFFVIGRTVNKTTGAATGDGVGILRMATPGSAHLQYGLDFNTTTVFGGAGTTYPATDIPTYSASLATGSSVPMGKTYVMMGALYAFDGTLTYYGPDITTASTFSASPFGTSHTYLAWGATVGGNFHAQQFGLTFANSVAATIWED